MNLFDLLQILGNEFYNMRILLLSYCIICKKPTKSTDPLCETEYFLEIKKQLLGVGSYFIDNTLYTSQ